MDPIDEQDEAQPGRDAEMPREALEGELAKHELTERRLAAATRELVHQRAERDRLDRERRVAAREFHEVQARFESAFSGAPIGMALVDMEGRWLQVNDALCRIIGLTQSGLSATALHSLTHPEDADRDARSFCDLLGRKIPSYQVEKRCRHAWGHYLWVLRAAMAAARSSVTRQAKRHRRALRAPSPASASHRRRKTPDSPKR